jgi:hypothetical protein
VVVGSDRSGNGGAAPSRTLQVQKEPPDVVLSLPMFERMLRMIAVNLMHADH